MSKMIKITEAHKTFQVSYWSLRRLVMSGIIPGCKQDIKNKPTFTIDENALREYLKSTNPDNNLVDRFVAASILGVGPRDVQKLAAAGRIPSEKANRIGRGPTSERLYPKDEIEKLAQQNRKPLSVTSEFGNYLAGLTDGEGSFNSNVKKTGRGYSLEASFKITLREDDSDIILLIREMLGFGYIVHYKHSNASKPSTTFETSRHADSMRLVELFDKYPLRAKKKRDYAIWREFVLERNNPHPDINKLIALSDEIVKVRKYVEPSQETKDAIASAREQYFHIRKVSSY